MSSGDTTAASVTMEAVFEALTTDAAFDAAVESRIFSDIPEDTPRPCVLYEIADEVDRRGFGTGGLPEMELRTHVFTDSENVFEGQALNLQIVALLKDKALTATGYTQAGLVVYRRSLPLRDEVLHGVKVHEIISVFTIWMEQ